MCLQGRIIRGTTLVRFFITIEAFKAEYQLFFNNGKNPALLIASSSLAGDQFIAFN
jgi:hypothetical protein